MSNFVIKPTSFHCNIECDYCFYLEKEKFMHPQDQEITPKSKVQDYMSVEQAKSFLENTIANEPSNHCYFTWQGGEPLMMGIDFFEEVVRHQKYLEKKYHKKISNAIQTNGILINAQWCNFFKNNEFLIGISIDGDQELHDRYRVTCSGKGTFKQVQRGIKLLEYNNIPFNTLTVVNAYNVKHPIRVYRFLKSLNVKFMQFIPVVETVETDCNFTPKWIKDPNFVPSLTEFSVDPKEYGEFMVAIFHEWSRLDIQNISIRLFDSYLERFNGYETTECIFRKRCGGMNMALEANGDIYQCDHFVYPGDEFKVGNVNTIDLTTIDQKTEPLSLQKENISKVCQNCMFLELCHGGCPKHRFLKTKDNEPISYFCESYQIILKNLTPGFNLISQFIQDKIPFEYLPQTMARVYPNIRIQPDEIRITNL